MKGNYDLSHLYVKNGGEFILPRASAKVNIYYGFDNYIHTVLHSIMENTTLSGSEGYGMLKSAKAIEKDFEAIGNNNTFSNYNLGNFYQE